MHPFRSVELFVPDIGKQLPRVNAPAGLSRANKSDCRIIFSGSCRFTRIRGRFEKDWRVFDFYVA